MISPLVRYKYPFDVVQGLDRTKVYAVDGQFAYLMIITDGGSPYRICGCDRFDIMKIMADRQCHRLTLEGMDNMISPNVSEFGLFYRSNDAGPQFHCWLAHGFIHKTPPYNYFRRSERGLWNIILKENTFEIVEEYFQMDDFPEASLTAAMFLRGPEKRIMMLATDQFWVYNFVSKSWRHYPLVGSVIGWSPYLPWIRKQELDLYSCGELHFLSRCFLGDVHIYLVDIDDVEGTIKLNKMVVHSPFMHLTYKPFRSPICANSEFLIFNAQRWLEVYPLKPITLNYRACLKVQETYAEKEEHQELKITLIVKGLSWKEIRELYVEGPSALSPRCEVSLTDVPC
ncbi:unnamed protein product, partial [Mesorhabditis spiculigera]